MQKPQALLAISVLCAETQAKADQMRKLADYTLLQFEKGNFSEMKKYEDIADYIFSDQELQRIEFNRGRIISGTPKTVRNELEILAGQLDIDEIMITTMTQLQKDRIRSLELIAEEFELKSQTRTISSRAGVSN